MRQRVPAQMLDGVLRSAVTLSADAPLYPYPPQRVLLTERQETELFWCMLSVVLLMTTYRVGTLKEERTRRGVARRAPALVFMAEKQKTTFSTCKTIKPSRWTHRTLHVMSGSHTVPVRRRTGKVFYHPSPYQTYWKSQWDERRALAQC